MNRYVMVLILTILFTGTVESQNSLSFGVKLQSEFSKLAIEELAGNFYPSGVSEEGIMAHGFSIGGILELKLTKTFFIRSGIDYEQSNYLKRVFGLRFGTGPAIVDERIRYNSIGIPMNFGIKLGKTEKLKFIFGIAALASIPLNKFARTEIDHESIPNEKLMKKEIIGNYSNISFIIFSGLECKLNNRIIVGLEPHIKLINNSFNLTPFDTVGKSKYEFGLTLNTKI